MTTIDLKSIRQLLWKPMLCLLVGGATLTGCIDDDEWCADGDGAGSIIPLGPDEYGIRFALSLDQLGGSGATRAVSYDGSYNGDAAENYVNFSTMRILLFDKDDNYVCDLLTETSICNVVDRTPEGTDERHWYVELAVSKLVDAAEGSIGETIMNCIEEKGFKILTLANWDRRTLANRVPDFVAGDPIKGKLSYIAHCSPDNTYAQDVSDEGMEHSAYKHIRTEPGMQGFTVKGYMGAYYDWVENHFADKEDVVNLMRQGAPMRTKGNADSSGGSSLDQSSAWQYDDTSEATPVKYDENKKFYYTRTERDGAKYEFSNIWQLWNFSNGQTLPYSSENNEEYNAKWQDLCTEEIRSFKSTNSFNGLTFTPSNSSDYVEVTGEENNKTGGYVKLTKLENNKEDNTDFFSSTPIKTTKGYIKFTAETKGTVRIKAKVTTALGVHSGTSANNIASNREYQDANAGITFPGAPEGVLLYSFEVGSSGDNPVETFIFAAGNDAEIYEVEYIKDVYLFNVDRISKQPDVDKEMGVPMYGIQEFDPVGEYWMPGEYFNVSRDSENIDRKKGYHYRYIWMLRSVAKVELKVSKHIGGHANIRPSSVYMASMNRSSRYEPKDFHSPTNLIWNGCTEYRNFASPDYYPYYDEEYGTMLGNKYYGIPSVSEEAENIKKHGAIFDKSNEDTQADQLEYRNFTAWVYGVWTYPEVMDWTWNNANNQKTGGDMVSQIIDEPSEDGRVGLPYPRVFNDRVWRSNNVRFIYNAEASKQDPEYWHYYLYMPDKYIDDSDDAGARSTNPKVPSIRIRFAYVGTDNDSYDLEADGFEYYTDNVNLENNRSYRIYFTDYSEANHPINNVTARNGFNDYERNATPDAQGRINLDRHWPIIRNSIYRFTLNGLNSSSITTEVYGADTRNVNIEFD